MRRYVLLLRDRSPGNRINFKYARQHRRRLPAPAPQRLLGCSRVWHAIIMTHYNENDTRTLRRKHETGIQKRAGFDLSAWLTLIKGKGGLARGCGEKVMGAVGRIELLLKSLQLRQVCDALCQPRHLLHQTKPVLADSLILRHHQHLIEESVDCRGHVHD